MRLDRRTLLAAGFAAPLVGLAAGTRAATAPRFSLAYAPHEGSFASRGDRLEQIAFAADQGFRAWEDNEAAGRTVAEQEAMARALRARAMTMGVFVAGIPDWSRSRPVLGGDDEAQRTGFLDGIRRSLDVANRLDARHATVVTGFADPRVPADIQFARVADTMRRARDIVAPHGLVLVMEPLNTRVNHPGIFLRTIAQGYAVARAVDDPHVKVLADLYHEQIQSGDLTRALDTCWAEIAYLQFGDNPGRNEPGTGEIDHHHLVRWLRTRAYRGVIGMEHGNSVDGRAGEERLVAAYRAIDAA